MPELRIGTSDEGAILLDPDAERYQAEGLRIGLFASSGAGKGYLLGVLIEELIAAGYPVVMVDPESELWTFRELGALVVGGEHGHVPFDTEAPAAILAALRFCLETATPLVFDLDGLSPNEVRAAFEVIAGPYWALINDLRRPSAFAITEAHLIAPEKLPRGAVDSELLSRIQSGGRKRGAITIVETQRMADIANDVIAHCNVRFVGRVDFDDDFKRVSRGLPRGVDFATVSALERGQFYAPRLAQSVIHVRGRRVTHGGATPNGEEVRLRKTSTPKALATMAKRLTTLTQSVSAEAKPTAVGEDRRRGRRDATHERQNDAPAGPVSVRLQELETQLAHTRTVLEQTSREVSKACEERDRYRQLFEQAHHRAEEQEVQLGAWYTLRDVLAAALSASAPSPSTGEGGGGGDSLTEDRVLALIRDHAGSTSSRAALRPVDALRSEYLERTAQRLVDIVRSLESDEREALLFHLAHPGAQTLNAVAKALSGSDSGSVRARWGNAVKSLAGKGLLHTAKNGTRRANVEQWAASNLAPHSPTDQELADVVERALSVVLVEDA